MYYKLNVELLYESYTTALSLPATDYEIQDAIDKIRVRKKLDFIDFLRVASILSR